MTKENMPQKDPNPVARIDYLYRGGVGESVEYTDPSEFYQDVKEQNYYGAPMSLVFYADAKGETIPRDFVAELDPPPHGVKISYANTPVYYQDFAYAHEHGEEEQFRTSAKINGACRAGIEKEIAAHYDGHVLDSGAFNQIIALFGYERTMCILANTIRIHDWDGRISNENKAWAAGVQIPDNHDMQHNVLNTNPGLVDLFTRMVRSRYLRTQALQEADIAAEASRIMNSFRSATEPNSPNGTHYMARVSEDFMARVRGQQTARLSRYFPFKTFHLTTLKGQKGLYAMISRNEDRTKPLRTPRTAARMKPSPGMER